MLKKLLGIWQWGYMLDTVSRISIFSIYMPEHEAIYKEHVHFKSKKWLDMLSI